MKEHRISSYCSFFKLNTKWLNEHKNILTKWLNERIIKHRKEVKKEPILQKGGTYP